MLLHVLELFPNQLILYPQWMISLASVPILFSGLVLCLLGTRIVRALVGVVSFFAFALLASAGSHALRFSWSTSAVVSILVAASFSIAVYRHRRLSTALLSWAVGMTVGTLLVGDLRHYQTIELLLGLSFGLAGLSFVRPMEILSTSILGGVLGGSALAMLAGNYEPSTHLILGVFFALCGVSFQRAANSPTQPQLSLRDGYYGLGFFVDGATAWYAMVSEGHRLAKEQWEQGAGTKRDLPNSLAGPMYTSPILASLMPYASLVCVGATVLYVLGFFSSGVLLAASLPSIARREFASLTLCLATATAAAAVQVVPHRFFLVSSFFDLLLLTAGLALALWAFLRSARGQHLLKQCQVMGEL